jgi:formylglycine-generating enzyme required for sulfatase activity
MPLLRIAILIVLLLLSSALQVPARGQDIGVRGGESSTEPKKSPTIRKTTPKQPTRTAPVVKPKRRVTLTVVTEPAECEVYINDVYRGTTGARNGKLVIPELDTEIRHSLRIYKRDTGENVQVLDLEGDRELNVSLNKVAEKKPEPVNKPVNKNEEVASNRTVDKKPEIATNRPPEKVPEKKEPEKKEPEKKVPEKPIEVSKVDTKPPETKPAEPVKTASVEPKPEAAEPKKSNPEPPPAITPPQSEMVLIPEGEFFMGRSKGVVIPNEKPQYKASLPAFYIDVNEVTNAEYKLFCDSTGRPYPVNPSWDSNYFLGKPNYPALNVSWDDANAYAKWVGKRLPTEEEWEKAARGSDGRSWPWGEEFQPGLANLEGKEDGFEFAAPVGSFRAGISIYGINDLTGNIWEWTSSQFKPHPGSTDQDERYNKNFRVIKGGGYQAPVKNLRSVAFRFPSEPSKTYEATGFRCAKSF